MICTSKPVRQNADLILKEDPRLRRKSHLCQLLWAGCLRCWANLFILARMDILGTRPGDPQSGGAGPGSPQHQGRPEELGRGFWAAELVGPKLGSAAHARLPGCASYTRRTLWPLEPPGRGPEPTWSEGSSGPLWDKAAEKCSKHC